MRYACFVATPVQVLNVVNMAFNDIEGMRGNCDLYILKQFSGFENMLPALRASGLFRNVYECVQIPLKKRSKPVSLAIGAAKAFFPGSFLKRWVKRDGFEKNEYDVLLMSGPTYLMVLLAEINRKARIWFYDEGVGSYMGNIMDHYVRQGEKRKRFLKAVFHTGIYLIQPERQYLNNTAFCRTTLACPRLPLPALDFKNAAFAALLREIFGAVDGLQGKDIVFLSQPVAELHTHLQGAADVDPEEVFRDLLTPLLPWQTRTIVRPHPREKEREYCGLDIDRSSTLWELICASSITDDHVLISLYSSALVSPKIMYDREPVVIFTYKLLQPPGNARTAVMEDLIERLRSSYRDPSRVYNVESLEQYEAVLAEAAGKRGREQHRKPVSK